MTLVARRTLPLFAAALLAPCIACAQSPATVPATSTFDVAAIRENTTSTDGHHHMYNDPAESHFRTVNLSIKDLVQFAYGIPGSQILGGPTWLDSAMYDIDAKSDVSVDAQLKALSAADARHQKQLMVQALLAERFQLRTHEETRQLPLFDLIVAKGGIKFKSDNKVGNAIDTGRNRLHISGMQDTVSILARELAQVLGHVVVNKTGVSGSYDLNLRWTPESIVSPMLNGAPDPNPPPDLFTAIQEQLGLKLESAKGPVGVLVIDHIERPAEN